MRKGAPRAVRPSRDQESRVNESRRHANAAPAAAARNSSAAAAKASAAAAKASAAKAEAAASATAAVEARQRPLWRARDIGIVVLAILATIAAAKVAAPLLVPVVLGLLGSYALRPLVTWLEQVRVPRWAGTLIVLTSFLAALGTAGWWLADDVAAAVAELPAAARKLRGIVHDWQQTGPGPISHVQEAATELGKTAAEVAGQRSAETTRAAAPAAPSPPTLASRLTENATLAIGLVGQLSIALLFTALMLTAGDAFRRKLVRIVGSSLARRRITVEILDEIDTQVQRQLLILVGVNLLIALVCWLAFGVAGLDRAALWATIVGLLHFVPYAGAVIATFFIGAVALVQTGSLPAALGFAVLTATITIAIGFLLMGWWQGRAVSMNAVATFAALLFFGWLWGAWGLIIGGPLMAIVKVCADRIESLKPLGELLGGNAPPR
jgi:predicted PurR-regulated permease PerM